jgi:DNA-binding transcriptional LysR family regulator
MSIRSIRQLSIFLEVARLESIRGAAESLGISQPAVSSALADLQREVGAALVQRAGRGIALTAGGRTLQEYGRRALALLDEASATLAATPETAQLRIAAVTTAAESFMPDLLRGFNVAFPQAQIELDVANRDRVWGRLSHWEVELVVAGRPPASPRFRTLAVRKNELVVVTARDGPTTAAALGAATWLLREAGSGTRAATEELFARLGISPTRLTIGSNAAIRECVRAGLGVSLLSTASVGEEIASGDLAVVPTPVTPLPRNWHVLTNADRVLSTGARRFLSYAIGNAAFAQPQRARDAAS